MQSVLHAQQADIRMMMLYSIYHPTIASNPTWNTFQETNCLTSTQGSAGRGISGVWYSMCGMLTRANWQAAQSKLSSTL